MSESYLYGKTLPRPTNKQAADLLRKTCNRFALAMSHQARQTLERPCVLCGLAIGQGDVYRASGMLRAHVFCMREMSQRLDGLATQRESSQTAQPPVKSKA